jgi:prepilin-type N-terminal cleavage/methylation domain-containing protein
MKRSVHAWLKKNATGRKGQQGFTLIELLVVVTILGVLAGIVTLSLVGLTTNASMQSCNQEYKTVQAALDAAMANNNLSTITPQPTATNDMTITLATTPAPASIVVKLYNLNPSSLTPNYTRNGTTAFKYTWDGFGRINGIFDANSKPMDPTLGCKVT